jgi:integrase/recombinase XerD
MNRRPPGLEAEEAVWGFLQFKTAEGLSPRTIECYECELRKWLEYQGELDVCLATSGQLLSYLIYLRTEFQPRHITGNNEQRLSSKTVCNGWVALAAFFHWVSEDFGTANPMKKVPAPKFTEPSIEPFKKEDIEAILKVCEYSDDAVTLGRWTFKMRRPSANRDQAIILMPLDAGLRATELCSLTILGIMSWL